jgi:HEAT repeat protein
VRERFISMFASDEPIHRLMAVYALGKLGVSRNMDILTQAIEDAVPDIRKVAIEALASECDISDDWQPLVLSKLNDESKDVRLTVIEIMGQCFVEGFIPHLIAALDDADDWVKIRAIDALGEHEAAQAVPKLIEMLENPNRFVVMKIIEALGSIGGTSAFRALLEITNSDEYELVNAAEESIAKIQEAQE